MSDLSSSKVHQTNHSSSPEVPEEAKKESILTLYESVVLVVLAVDVGVLLRRIKYFFHSHSLLTFFHFHNTFSHDYGQDLFLASY